MQQTEQLYRQGKGVSIYDDRGCLQFSKDIYFFWGGGTNLLSVNLFSVENICLIKGGGGNTAVVDVEDPQEENNKELEEGDQGEERSKEQAHPAYRLATSVQSYRWASLLLKVAEKALNAKNKFKARALLKAFRGPAVI